MDNLACHKRVGMSRAIERAGGRPHCLPAYSPDFNLIAQACVDRTVWLSLISGAAETVDLVLEQSRGDQQPELQGHALQGVLHQLEQLFPIQGQLDLSPWRRR
jgi:hypothetical protein